MLGERWNCEKNRGILKETFATEIRGKEGGRPDLSATGISMRHQRRVEVGTPQADSEKKHGRKKRFRTTPKVIDARGLGGRWGKVQQGANTFAGRLSGGKETTRE